MSFVTESEKIKPTIQKYLDGKKVIVDIGCGKKKITPEAIGVEMNFDSAADIVINPADIYNLWTANKIPKADVVFSSHCLEHLADPIKALQSWRWILKPEGLLILYLPDGRYYDNKSNREHLQDWTMESFLVLIGELDHAMETIEVGPHVGDGCYSFYVVLKARK